MIKITRYLYRAGGITYSGVCQGHVSASEIQAALLAKHRPCQRVLEVRHYSQPLR